MKNLFKTLFVSIALVGTTACETETELVEIPDSVINEIAQAAASAAAQAVADDIPTTSEVATAVQNAISDDIDNAIDSAVQSATTEAPEETPAEIHHSGFVTADETWANTSIHILDNKVIVADGATLTIEAGAVVKAAINQQPDVTALIVARGADLYAVGNAQHPIVFTAETDEVRLDQTYATSPNLGADDNGLWGGLVILGYARISDENNAGVNQAEGIEATNAWAEYGGTNDDDNSGVMEYITIKHAGAALTSDNELNQFTLCGVGRNTTINNIEVYAGSDDGMEFFGGAVGVTNFLAYHVSDDSVDTDEAFSGSVDNAVIIQHPTLSSDHAMELSGRLGTYEAATQYSFSDFTIVMGGVTDNVFKFKDNLKADFDGIWVKGLTNDNKSKIKVELADWTEAAAGDVTMDNIVISTGTVTGVTETYILSDLTASTEVTNAELAGSFTVVAAETKPSNAGADTSVFGWTFAVKEEDAINANGL